ncbi:hypothetical protein [Streptomyces sp. NPDC002788]
MSIPTIEATTAMRRVQYICVGFLPLDRLPPVAAGFTASNDALEDRHGLGKVNDPQDG